MLAGTSTLISKARRFRKMMGGTLRQVGVLAQPAIIGLTQMIEPLKEDNAMAKKLADGLKCSGLRGNARILLGERNQDQGAGERRVQDPVDDAPLNPREGSRCSAGCVQGVL
jgi:hypothetical protein